MVGDVEIEDCRQQRVMVGVLEEDDRRDENRKSLTFGGHYIYITGSIQPTPTTQCLVEDGGGPMILEKEWEKDK